MERTHISYGTMRPQVINAIFDSSSPFTVNEIARSRGLLYKSVKRIIDQLVEEGYISKNPSALKPVRPDGKFKVGRPKDAYYLVADHEKIRELRTSVPRDNLPIIEDEESLEPTSFYYQRAKNALDQKEESGPITDKDIVDIIEDLKRAIKEEKLVQTELSPIKNAYFDFQKGRIAYAQGYFKEAISKFSKVNSVFLKNNIPFMAFQTTEKIFNCIEDYFEFESIQITKNWEESFGFLSNYIDEHLKVCTTAFPTVKLPTTNIRAATTSLIPDFESSREPLGVLKSTNDSFYRFMKIMSNFQTTMELATDLMVKEYWGQGKTKYSRD